VPYREVAVLPKESPKPYRAGDWPAVRTLIFGVWVLELVVRLGLIFAKHF
jgi:hypothetical protein